MSLLPSFVNSATERELNCWHQKFRETSFLRKIEFVVHSSVGIFAWVKNHKSFNIFSE